MNDLAREEQWSAWMRAAMGGDTAAYHRFLSSVAPHLRTMARRRCAQFGAPASEAEDIVQEVLLSIHLKRGTWDPSRPIAPWISTIIRNKLIDSLRRRGRHVDVPLDDVIAVLQVDEQGQAQERLDVDRILKTLKEPQRTIVQAISLEGSSVRETAGRVNMTEGAVRVALHRALKALSLTYREPMT
jgi:RNA polymerase sigma-70 factor (ECF subfamily)